MEESTRRIVARTPSQLQSVSAVFAIGRLSTMRARLPLEARHIVDGPIRTSAGMLATIDLA